MIEPHDHVLFYGDSITDCGRERTDPTSLGSGYVRVISEQLFPGSSERKPRITNQGISGNRIYDLEARLDQDVISLHPTLVSILVGINDTWHSFKHGKPSSISDFCASYDRILSRLKGEASTRVVICEPFLLPNPEDRRSWRPDLDERITVIRYLAWKHEIPYLPLDGAFAAAAVGTGHAHWLPDGVHPSAAGHELIAKRWINQFQTA